LRRTAPLAAALAWAAVAAGAGPLPQASSGEADIARLQAEATQRSRVMEFAEVLTDTYGARLTGSPAALGAGEYARAKLAEFGLSGARLEPWRFGPGWANERVWLRMVAPYPAPLIAYPRAWTPSTAGAVTGAAVHVTGRVPADLDKYRGTLKGKIALVDPAPERPDDPRPARLGDADLVAWSRPPDANAKRAPRVSPEERDFMNKRDQLFVEEGVVAALEPSRLVRNGTVLVARSGARLPGDPKIVPTLVLGIEHYGRIVRLLERQVPVRLEVDVLNRAYAETDQSFNVVAEIPGTDRKDEVVMLGGHLDAWHAGTGATDNAAGCAVMMEAVRILKVTAVPLRRTVRIALWMGEEQGLLGSKAYVKEHLADRATMALRPEHARLSTYLNLDAGTGAIRGIFLQGNEAARPVFQQWLAPVAGLGAATISIRNSMPGGSDHQSFDEIGVPAFQFIQDPSDYEDRTHTHHTNMDVYEALDADALRKNAAIVAAIVYQAANHATLVPRKPLPSPPPAAAPAGTQD
jgi:carboxypeptidase Q